MIEYEQKYIYHECKLCGKDEFGEVHIRKFVTCADDPDKAVCCECGFTVQLNNKEEKNGNTGKAESGNR